MARHSIFFVLVLLVFIVLANAASDDQSEEPGVYIVYMGGKGSSTPGTLRDDQAQIMNSFLKRSILICTALFLNPNTVSPPLIINLCFLVATEMRWYRYTSMASLDLPLICLKRKQI